MSAKISLFNYLFIFLFGLSAWSSPCGNYQAKGIVRAASNGLILIIAEGTKSQVTVEPDSATDTSLSAYVNNFIEVSFTVEKMPDGTLFKTKSFYDIRQSIRDPLSSVKKENPKAVTQTPCKP